MHMRALASADVGDRVDLSLLASAPHSHNMRVTSSGRWCMRHSISVNVRMGLSLASKGGSCRLGRDTPFPQLLHLCDAGRSTLVMLCAYSVPIQC